MKLHHHHQRPEPPQLLGIEGGGTRTVALLASASLSVVQRCEAGPGNVRLLDDAQLRDLFQSLQLPGAELRAVAIGMAGARTEADRRRIRLAAAEVWPGVPCYATHDLETALAAGAVGGIADPRKPLAPEVLVLSGTGSCCYGRAPSGATVRTGGWGHWLGDRGSAYDIALRALRRVVESYDQTGCWPALGGVLLRRTLLNEPDDLIGWMQRAGKEDVAALAVSVFEAAKCRDSLAREVLTQAAEVLAANAVACAGRLAAGTRKAPVRFVLAGGTLLKQPAHAREVGRHIRRSWPQAVVQPLERESAWGAVELARRLALEPGRGSEATVAGSRARRVARSLPPRAPASTTPWEPLPLSVLARSPTERRNPRSARLHELPVTQAIELMLSEDARIPDALRAERKPIERAVQAVVRAFRRGGRLFYVGAGTSGRLGVLDASECPPTFRSPPDQVQGIMAGGQRALWEAVEGAEDDPDAGGRAVGFRRVGARDVVVGIAASGRTPFVWGALRAARARRATTVLLCFNPSLKRWRRHRPSIVIAPDVGPEVLTGSTRLKAGTATKIVLNLLTTLAMVRVGKVVGNLMVDLNPSNVKLRDRAIRIVCELTGAGPERARQALERSGWVVKRALQGLRTSKR